MNEFDLRLKAMAEAEDCPAPEGFDARMEHHLNELIGKRSVSRPVRRLAIAACLCAVLTMAAGAATYLLSARDAMRQVYSIGMVYQRDGVRYEMDEAFLNLLENEYTMEVNQTAEGDNMDVTLVNTVAFETGNSCVIGYLVHFTLPDGITPEEDENYYFGGSYHSRVAGSNGAWNGNYQKMLLIPTGENNSWYAFITQRLLGGVSNGTAVLELSDFCTTKKSFVDGYGFLEAPETLVAGAWRFEVELDSKAGTALTEAPVSVVDNLTRICSLSVSPMGVELRVLRNGTFDTPTDEACGGWDTDEVTFDAWHDAVAHNSHLILNSGDRVALYPVGEITNDAEGGVIEAVWFYSFATPTDLTCVSAVEVAGVEFPLTDTE